MAKTTLEKFWELVDDENNYTQWEDEFLDSILEQLDKTLGSLSEKQKEKIEEIHDRYYTDRPL